MELKLEFFISFAAVQSAVPHDPGQSESRRLTRRWLAPGEAGRTGWRRGRYALSAQVHQNRRRHREAAQRAQAGLRLLKKASIPSAASSPSQQATSASIEWATSASDGAAPSRNASALARATAPGAQDK